jgi:hypothetical protein
MTSKDPLQLESILAEYNALRQELVQRIGNRVQLLTASSTISTVLIGIALERRSAALFLVVPLAACLFGYQMLFEHVVVSQIGSYIRDRIEPILRLAGYDFTGWETTMSSRRLWRGIPAHLPTGLSTLIPSLVALLLAWFYPAHSLLKALLYIVDFLIVGHYLFEYQRHIRRSGEIT